MVSLKDKFERRRTPGNGSAYEAHRSEEPRLVNVEVAQVELDPSQPRKDLGDLEGLIASVQQHGILQPLIVCAVEDQKFRLIAGERRFSAAKAVGLPSVPAIIRTMDQHQRIEVQLVENLHRKDLNPLEEASALHRLIEEFQLSQRELAKRLGRSPTAINQTLRILTLPREILDENPSADRLSRSVLLEMVKIGSAEAQLAFWRGTQDAKPTVKQARAQRSNVGNQMPTYRFPRIRVPGATVQVTLAKEFGTHEDLKEVLRAALMSFEA